MSVVKKLMTLSDVGEFGLIRHLREAFVPGDTTTVGIGDDCAVMHTQPERWELWTTDTMVEGRHFRLSWNQHEAIGWKLIASSVSDIAAMGGTPRGVLLTFQIPSTTPFDQLAQIVRGIKAASAEFGAPVLGGDTVAGTELALTASVLGDTDSPPLLRSGARPGDDVWVSGTIGESGIGLRLLEHETLPIEERAGARFVERHLRPTPRLELGRALRKAQVATAALDVSDGLLGDLFHIATESGVDVELLLGSVPVPELHAPFDVRDLMRFGEDYELCFTAPAERRDEIQALSSLCPVSRIGRCVTRCGEVSTAVLFEGAEFEHGREMERVSAAEGRGGFDHFSLEL